MNRERLRAALIDAEELRLRMYKDSQGYHTIGVGHNLDAKPISRRAALIILEDDINDAEHQTDNLFTWWRSLPEIVQNALVEMVFNLGPSRILTFSKMLAAMEDGDYEKAAKEAQDSLWFKQVGRRGPRIVSMIREGSRNVDTL